jgi:hypothetical protein
MQFAQIQIVKFYGFKHCQSHLRGALLNITIASCNRFIGMPQYERPKLAIKKASVSQSVCECVSERMGANPVCAVFYADVLKIVSPKTCRTVTASQMLSVN